MDDLVVTGGRAGGQDDPGGATALAAVEPATAEPAERASGSLVPPGADRTGTGGVGTGGVGSMTAGATPVVAGRARAVFVVVCAAIFMSNLDLFVVNVAFPDIHRDLGGGLSALSWVLNAYAIVFAALLVPAGRLADRYGHRAGFLLGTGLFTLASAVCAASPGLATLIAGRAIQAAGAAVLIPTSLALLLDATPPARRAGAVRGWAAVGGLAAALGPVVGGLLVEANWRWVFLINVPVGVVTLVAGVRVLPRPRKAAAGRLPDFVGVLALTAGIGLLALGLVESSSWGWGSARVIGALVASVVLLAGFVVRSARHPAPVVELSVLRAPGFGPAVVALLLFSVAFAAMLLSVVQYMDAAWGWSALRIGLAITPGPAMVPPVALLLAGRAVGRFGLGRVAGTGSVLFAAGVAWWALRIDLHSPYASSLLPGMLLTGVGVGLVLPTLTAGASTVLPPDRFATGSAVVNMSRQIASVLGVAILVAVVGSPGRNEVVRSFHHGWWFVAATALGAGLAAFTGLSRGPARPVAAGR
jgi:EmrB/QacA subfamily drug resistance transporter